MKSLEGQVVYLYRIYSSHAWIVARSYHRSAKLELMLKVCANEMCTNAGRRLRGICEYALIK